MAVETLYRSTRAPEVLMTDRKAADEYDAMLELAERVTAVIQKAVPGISDNDADNLGVYMAKHRDVFAKAFSKKPELLDSLINPPSDEPTVE